jgi:hypothetical protein
MAINWQDAKPDAIAVHRNGGRSVIKDVEFKSMAPPWTEGYAFAESYKKLCAISFRDSGCEHWFREDGCMEGYQCADAPFDIIEIIPAPEPVRVTLYWGIGYVPSAYECDGHTHRIIFNTINGEPDCNSIVMENLA